MLELTTHLQRLVVEEFQCWAAPSGWPSKYTVSHIVERASERVLGRSVQASERRNLMKRMCRAGWFEGVTTQGARSAGHYKLASLRPLALAMERNPVVREMEERKRS